MKYKMNVRRSREFVMPAAQLFPLWRIEELACFPNEGTRLHAEQFFEQQDGPQAGLFFPAFESRDVGLFEIGIPFEVALPEVEGKTPPPKCLSEGFFRRKGTAVPPGRGCMSARHTKKYGQILAGQLSNRHICSGGGQAAVFCGRRRFPPGADVTPCLPIFAENTG